MRIRDIEEVFDNLLGIQRKCMTLDRIREKLTELSQSEKNDLLGDKLNEAEKDYYGWLVKEHNDLTGLIDEYEHEDVSKYPKGMVEGAIRELKKVRENNEELLFGYEKRIYNKYELKKPKNHPTVDMDKYYQEKENPNEGTEDIKYEKLEQSMIDSQKGIFSDENVDALQSYYSDGFSLLNSRLYNGKQWNKLSKRQQDYNKPKLDKLDKQLTDAIDKTEGLPYPARLYHFGEFDVSKVVGDKVEFKGFLSTTFQKYVAETWGDTYHSHVPKYTYELLVDTGKKGVCANDDSHGKLTHMNYEHELLLGKGVSGDIVNIDVKNHIVTVKVDG